MRAAGHDAPTRDSNANRGFIDFSNFGPMQVLDRDYRPRDTSPPPGVISETLDPLRRFRASD